MNIIKKFICALVLTLIISSISISAIPVNEEIKNINNLEPSNMQVVTITRPVPGNIYIFDTIVIPIGGSNIIIIGPITLQATAQPTVAAVTWMVYDNNGNAWHPDVYPPTQPPNFQLLYNTVHRLISIILAGPQAVITAIAVDPSGNTLGTASLNSIKIF